MGSKCLERSARRKKSGIYQRYFSQGKREKNKELRMARDKRLKAKHKSRKKDILLGMSPRSPLKVRARIIRRCIKYANEKQIEEYNLWKAL